MVSAKSICVTTSADYNFVIFVFFENANGMQMICAWQMHAINAILLPFLCYVCFKNINHDFKKHFIRNTNVAKLSELNKMDFKQSDEMLPARQISY